MTNKKQAAAALTRTGQLLPAWVFTIKTTSSAKLALAYVLWCGGSFNGSIAELARNVGISKQTACNSLDLLQSMKLLKCTPVYDSWQMDISVPEEGVVREIERQKRAAAARRKAQAERREAARAARSERVRAAMSKNGNNSFTFRLVSDADFTTKRGPDGL